MPVRRADTVHEEVAAEDGGTDTHDDNTTPTPTHRPPARAVASRKKTAAAELATSVRRAQQARTVPMASVARHAVFFLAISSWGAAGERRRQPSSVLGPVPGAGGGADREQSTRPRGARIDIARRRGDTT
eukprot:COSAG01_NODE_5796_length_4030_cov_20.163317_2_plen_130_part_00